MTTPRFLINTDGSPFDKDELNSLKSLLDGLSDGDREDFRNKNADQIAEDDSQSTLIVSGPGTGKSTIFLKRIEYWLKKYPTAKVRVVSFVRKLVADLQEDVTSNRSLSDEQKGQVNVSTLHRLARSVVEKNGGTTERPFKAHSKIIVDHWEEEVWEDAKQLLGIGDGYTWKEMLENLHNANLSKEDRWSELITTYFKITNYYNAICFADMVILAASAVAENPELVEEDFFILDEYQDFNQAEDNFVTELTKNAKSILMVGDDDQVLYEKLKAGKAELIRKHYSDLSKANAMLPFCGRCAFHTTKASSEFINIDAEENCIDKVYLPLRGTEEGSRVTCVACPNPASAIDYVKKFINENKEALDERKAQLEDGTKKDAFLLILSPDKKLAFYGNEKDGLSEAIAAYQTTEKLKYGEDYFKVLTYNAFGNDETNNFAFRKILTYESVSRNDITTLIREALDAEVDFTKLDKEIVRSITEKSKRVVEVLENDELDAKGKAQAIATIIEISDIEKLEKDILQSTTEEEGFKVEHEDEEAAELEEIEPSKANAIELMSIVGSKGLSADHVIILGFDDKNMGYVTRNAFYVAMTRARKSLHILTALRCRGSSGPNAFFQALPEAHLQFVKHIRTNSATTVIASKADYVRYFRSVAHARNQARQ
ncbi:AAA family ATPase [Patescibacteria group bacterium]|nr:AAA family ATPase [Patescibacteria group bacterium]